MPGTATSQALDVIRMLALDIGPRKPCSQSEADAARAIVAWWGERGVEARTESFMSYPSFGYPIGTVLATSLAGGLLQTGPRGDGAIHRRRLGDALAVAGFAGLALEADLRVTPVSQLISKRPSVNVVASVPPVGETLHRVCLCAHTDTTRSGLMFHPRVIRHLPRIVETPVAGALLLALGPLVRRLPPARAAHALALLAVGGGLALVVERELRGEDVPGASDNASGCGVVAQLAVECAARPLRHTRVDVLISGSEEVGVRGARSYVRAHRDDVPRAMFVNFDTVGGDVPLTYVLREGAPLGRPASPRLVRLAEKIARRRPDLGLRPAAATPGLPTDVTVALAGGLEGITFLAQGRTVPNYHWPTDTFENVEPRTIARALEVGRELLAELDSPGM